MELVRIGEKLISVQKIHNMVEELLQARSRGLSQSEAATQLGLDRAFVSRLESLGEVRRGRSIALIGFPVANKDSLQAVCQRWGVDFVWLMTDRERREFAESRSGIELVNEIFRIAHEVRSYDTVILMASNMRVRLLTALLDMHAVIPIILGETPLNRDVEVDVDVLESIIKEVQGQAGDGDPLSKGDSV
ncbi:helix-turn-helix domain-containing protein [Sulfobacillus harzensis]|uniref:Transcriptional regulator n=1 Tax=Sulfobacillus harzensis TaxID=2729629 RepID=A0A7Y0Q2S3_9FIRM|nr:transcriptional regulator [Sulfobacillus harzensis]NMP21454.1 transcriptional regulator [Sulfobacillus harzensis]